MNFSSGQRIVPEGTLANPINIADVYGYVKTQPQFIFGSVDDI